MAEPTLYERLGGIFAIAAVIDNFSDRLVQNPKIVNANPELREWHTVTYHTRMPGLKWGRTLWVAMKAGGPFQYTGLEMRDAHFDLKISPEVFDEVTQELINAISVPRRARLRPVPSRGRSTGAAGAEPGVIRTPNLIKALPNTQR
jgi:hemoglobin